MQNTRLNNLVEALVTRLGQWLTNPWRRISVILISLLLGVFLGTAIPTTAGQTAEWDVVAAGILILVTEFISRIVYGPARQNAQSPEEAQRGSLFRETINSFKIGLTYSLFVEAFKLGS
jgi:hypothetical protein